MTTATAPAPVAAPATTATPHVTAPSPPPPDVPTVGAAVRQASEAVAALDLCDARWVELGPLLTAFVDAARRAVGLAGSPIAPGEVVSPVLRLRDLGRLAARAASADASASPAPPQVAAGVRSLQAAARRCPSG